LALDGGVHGRTRALLAEGSDSKDPRKAHRQALDIFTIWSTMTEPEFVAAEALRADDYIGAGSPTRVKASYD